MHFTSPKGYNRESEYPLRIKRQEFDDSSTQSVTLQEPLTLFTKNKFVTIKSLKCIRHCQQKLCIFCSYRLFREILEAAVNCNEISFHEDGSWRPINDLQGIKNLSAFDP